MPCSVCPEEAAKLSVCSRCGIVTYCGKQVRGQLVLPAADDLLIGEVVQSQT